MHLSPTVRLCASCHFLSLNFIGPVTVVASGWESSPLSSVPSERDSFGNRLFLFLSLLDGKHSSPPQTNLKLWKEIRRVPDHELEFEIHNTTQFAFNFEKPVKRDRMGLRSSRFYSHNYQ